MSGTTIRFRRNTSVEWTALNPVLMSGEPGFETDTGKEKRGDGVSRWTELEYFLPESHVVSLVDTSVDAAVAEIVIDAGGVSFEQLEEHVESPNPHPAYDDGPSFLLLYQNAKV